MRIKLGFGGIVMLLGMLFTSGGFSGAVLLLTATIHELGHIISARICNIELSEMALDFAGARISVRGGVMAYRDEFILSIAGAGANLLSVGAVLSVAVISGNISQVFELFGGASVPDGGAAGVIYTFIFSSLSQAAVNLLPIRSFDGGQALFCLLAPRVGIRRAEVTLNILSGICGILLWSISVYFLMREGVGVSLFAFAVSLFFRLIS